MPNASIAREPAVPDHPFPMRSRSVSPLVAWAAGLWLASFPALTSAEQAEWKIIAREFIEPAPAVAEVHASTVVEAADGTLVAAWLGGTKEGNPDVAIWSSRFEGGKWTAARNVTAGTGGNNTDRPAYDPVLYRASDGGLTLFFSTGLLGGELMVSRDNGVSWSGRRKLPDGITGAVRGKPLPARDDAVIVPSSRLMRNGLFEVRMETGDESFQNWKSVRIADEENLRASQPVLVPLGEGKILALCRTGTGKIARSTSEDSGATWSALEATSLPMIDSALDAIALRDGGYLLAYNPGEAPKQPKDTDPREPRCPLVVSFSEDAVSWQPVVTLEDRPTRWGYAYPSLVQAADGRVHVTYTWNRGRIRHAILGRGTP